MSEIKKILKELESKGYSRPCIERIFGLSFGYLKDENLKKRNVNKKEIRALLRIIKCYPWILKGADAPVNFDEKESQHIMCHAAVDVVLK